MTLKRVLQLCVPLAIGAGGVLVSAQQLLPSAPLKQFGGSISPAFEGWWDNPDGTHSFLLGYYSRNTEQELDVPLGPNNHFEPGEPDRGQPTHFLSSRRYGMFTVTMPKEFTRTQKLTWVLNVAGYNTSVPVYMSPDYNITPQRSSEQGPDGQYNLPPVIRFDPNGATFAFPAATPSTAVSKTTTVGTPMTLEIYATDDARYTSGANAPMRKALPIVTLVVSKYRGPGTVTIADSRPKVEATKGGQPQEPFAGKASTTVTFGAPGDYLLHVTANDYSGNGGGGAACCWSTALVKVAVTGGHASTTGGQ
jgi:hypothetical protein